MTTELRLSNDKHVLYILLDGIHSLQKGLAYSTWKHVGATVRAQIATYPVLQNVGTLFWHLKAVPNAVVIYLRWGFKKVSQEGNLTTMTFVENV
jgi:hypothetical protein